MEDTLRVNNYFKIERYEECLNPYYNGRYSPSVHAVGNYGDENQKS